MESIIAEIIGFVESIRASVESINALVKNIRALVEGIDLSCRLFGPSTRAIRGLNKSGRLNRIANLSKRWDEFTKKQGDYTEGL